MGLARSAGPERKSLTKNMIKLTKKDNYFKVCALEGYEYPPAVQELIGRCFGVNDVNAKLEVERICFDNGIDIKIV